MLYNDLFVLLCSSLAADSLEMSEWYLQICYFNLVLLDLFVLIKSLLQLEFLDLRK